MVEQLTNDEIEDVLKNNALGRIGCGNEKKMHVVPVNYVYDGQYIFGHSKEGMKIYMMRDNANVCFQVDEVQDFTNWRSVIVWGIYQELTDERSRYFAMKAFTEKILPLKISSAEQVIQQSEIYSDDYSYTSSKSVIYRIVINEKSGRFEKNKK